MVIRLIISILGANTGTSLVIQWLKLPLSIQRVGFDPGWGAKITYALWPQKKKKKKENNIVNNEDLQNDSHKKRILKRTNASQ